MLSTHTMKAVVIHEAGAPEVLKVESRPIPKAEQGWVLIQVKAFGLNRSEMFTRQVLAASFPCALCFLPVAAHPACTLADTSTLLPWSIAALSCTSVPGLSPATCRAAASSHQARHDTVCLPHRRGTG